SSLRRPPASPLLPYTTLFRSDSAGEEPDFHPRRDGEDGFPAFPPFHRHRNRPVEHHPGLPRRRAGRFLGYHPRIHGCLFPYRLRDRKSTRLNSSHVKSSSAVC